MKFQGYQRENGTVGVRNHLLVLSSVSCANGVVEAIGRELPGVVPVTHGYGCGYGDGRGPSSNYAQTFHVVSSHVRSLAHLNTYSLLFPPREMP